MAEAASMIVAATAMATGNSISDGTTNGGSKGKQRWAMLTVAAALTTSAAVISAAMAAETVEDMAAVTAAAMAAVTTAATAAVTGAAMAAMKGATMVAAMGAATDDSGSNVCSNGSRDSGRYDSCPII